MCEIKWAAHNNKWAPFKIEAQKLLMTHFQMNNRA